MSVNLADPKSFHDAVPHAAFERLRREKPVHWTPTSSGTPHGGFWSLTRFADIANTTRDPATFTSRRGISYPVLPARTEGMADNLMYNDPPDHTRLRRLVGAAFTPRMVARFGDWITERVDAIIADLRGRGECDLVPLIAVELPAQVICSVMGVPENMRAQVVAWANDLFSREIPDGGVERAMKARAAVMNYALELRDRNWDTRGDNMISELAVAQRDGASFTDSEYVQMVMTLVIAGFETTHTLIGQSLRLILENPDIESQARAAVAAGNTRELVEEFLRYVTPAMHMGRHATRDVVLHDTTIKEGDTVLLWFVSANRDDSVFENPHTFDASRPRNRHQSFGAGGPHFCLGNHLARLEVQILFERLFTDGLKITLNGQPQRGWTIFINQLRALPAICQ